MRTKLIFIHSQLLSSILLISSLFSCGSYQMVSYYGSDGIYGGEVALRKSNLEEAKTNDSEVYYKNYFSNIADNYSSFDNTENIAYTDSDNYSSNENNNDFQVNSQAPWGDRTSSTEVYYINNNPLGFFNFNWGFYNSFFDPFWNFNPFFNRGFYRPYWGLSFYDPFFRFRYPFYINPFYTPGFRFRGYYGNRFDRSYAYSNYSRGSGRYNNFSTLRGGNSGKGYNNSYNSSENRYNPTNSKSNSVNNNRYNVGRRTSQTTNRSNSTLTRKANNQSSQNNQYNKRSQSNSSYSSSSRRNYNTGRSYGSSRSSYSSGNRSSYSSSSRVSGGGRSSSRGR